MSDKKNAGDKNEVIIDSSVKRLQGASMGTNHFGNVAEEVGSYKTTWRKLFKYCKKHIPVIVFALILAIVGAVLQITVPSNLKNMTDLIQYGITESININAVIRIAVTLGIMYACIALLNFFQNYTMAAVTAKISENLRTEISRKISRLTLKYFDNANIGDIVSRISNDVDTIGQTLNQNIGTLMTSSVLFIGSLALMLRTNHIMALTAIAASIVGFVSSKAVLSRSKKIFKSQQVSLGAVGGHVEEIFSAHNVVKAYNGIASEKRAFTMLNQQLYFSAWKAQFVSGFITPLMQFSGSLAYVAVCVVGATLIMHEQASFGIIVAFIMYVNLFTTGLTHILETFPGLQGTTAASERVFSLLDEEELADESHKTQSLSKVQGEVIFENIKFGYYSEKPVIHDFSTHVKPGQKIAIVGPTGAGKTTIVNLLMRFYELDNGSILIDGLPTDQVTRANLHDQFSMVLQDTWLFEGTVEQNIIYNKKNVSPERVIEVCKAIGLHRFISAMPEKYNSQLGDGNSLSEGQKQLIAIARAMIHDAPMLILDEATSSVDTRTESLVQNAMDKLMTGKTSFIIAHRLSTIKNADLILALKDGDVVQCGTHEQLLAEGGFYSELYNSQFGL